MFFLPFIGLGIALVAASVAWAARAAPIQRPKLVVDLTDSRDGPSVFLPAVSLQSLGQQCVAMLSYALALSQLLDASSARIPQCTGYIALAVALEFDSRPATPALLWRARAASRLIAGCLLASTHVINFLAAPSTTLMAGIAIAAACESLGLLMLLFAGPARPEACASPPPPLRCASLWPKLLFGFWVGVLTSHVP